MEAVRQDSQIVRVWSQEVGAVEGQEVEVGVPAIRVAPKDIKPPEVWEESAIVASKASKINTHEESLLFRSRSSCLANQGVASGPQERP